MAFQIIRRASAQWQGSDAAGAGTISLGSGAFEGPYSLKSRVNDEPQTNPEELIGAALAGCFAMALSSKLAESGNPPTKLDARSRVKMEEEPGRFSITQIQLEIDGVVPGLTREEFFAVAEDAKKTCPVSRALAGTVVELVPGSFATS